MRKKFSDCWVVVRESGYSISLILDELYTSKKEAEKEAEQDNKEFSKKQFDAIKTENIKYKVIKLSEWIFLEIEKASSR